MRQSKKGKKAFRDCAEHGTAEGRGDAQVDWQKFVGRLFTGKTILDVGAGLGQSRARLSAGGNKVTLQDPAPLASVDLHTPVHMLGDEGYDVVTAFDVIEHVREDVSFLGHLVRVAREAVFLTTPNWEVSKAGNPHHVREYTPGELLDMVTALGLPSRFYTGDGWGLGLREVPASEFVHHTEPAHGVLILKKELPTLPVTAPKDSRREIVVAGYPSYGGGADTELDHQIDLWRANDVRVTLVPLFVDEKTGAIGPGGVDPAMRAKCDARGCFTRAYRPGIFRDKLVVSFCNGAFLKALPTIVREGRPACVVWANCMTWTFAGEELAHKEGWIDYHVFQSDYQKDWLLRKLLPLNPVHTLRYLPYYNPAGGTQEIVYSEDRPAAYYGIGRVSRDDGAKFPADLWRTYDRIAAPVPKKAFVLGYGPKAREKCGSPPPTLDWATWAPGGVPAKDLYARIHTLVHMTGGSRENLPRIMLEAWQSGTALVCERDYGLRENVQDGVTGFLCGGSEEAVYRASQLAFDPALRLRIVRAGNEFLRETYGSAETCWKGWEYFFTRQLDGDCRPIRPAAKTA